MTVQRPDPHDLPVTESTQPEHQPGVGHQHGGHRLIMMICCVPMVAIAVLLLVTGVAGSGIIVSALLCVAMMAAMMFAMPGGHGHK
ncbi:conserved hypothetical protein [Nostocoides australiense Ben110]|jgi:hypothetical protein|uniref:Uncharacterized protein n=1 Tax=Nostocoides australiense Ben110 TaxID=1193182 RepID=W6K255_9MICO|nr:hypothetical protein [Tetrasphaera australiensis]CCH75130.1 conserved hypothetical protein [Tetrasphaera australiensis Ben110]